MTLTSPSNSSNLVESHCHILLSASRNNSAAENFNVVNLQKNLENSDVKVKIKTLEQIICLMLQGNSLNRLLMPVIKFCLPSDNHMVKKLLHIYWVIVDKKDSKGKLLPEMILVCNALLQDLQHSNEYIRGSTLRLLCSLNEPEILEPLKQSITNNLEHNNSYVRKNAVMAMFKIYSNNPEIIPDACSIIENFILNENDNSVRRNAFLMLFQCDQQAAIEFLGREISRISFSGEAFQMIVLELIRKIFRQGFVDYNDRLHYQNCVFQLLRENSSKTVQYEAANTILTIPALGNSSRATKAALSSMIDIVLSESDNNVKLIILDRLMSLRSRHLRILQTSVMDIMKALSSPNIDIRRKVLDLTRQLTCSSNIDDVIGFLKKEIIANEKNIDQANSIVYRNLLVETIHQCAVKFPAVASNVVHVLMNYLGDDNKNCARDVIYFVREIVEEYPKLRSSIVTKLLENFDQICRDVVFRAALQILGEYSEDLPIIEQALLVINNNIGILNKNQYGRKFIDNEKDINSGLDTEENFDNIEQETQQSKLADLIFNQKGYFLASSLTNSYSKLVLKYSEIVGFGSFESNKKIAEAIFLFTFLLQFDQRFNKQGTEIKHYGTLIDRDSYDRIILCIKCLMNPFSEFYRKIFVEQCHQTFVDMINENKSSDNDDDIDKKIKNIFEREVDDLICIRQLRNSEYNNQDFDDNDDQADINRAVGKDIFNQSDFTNRIGKIKQLTGLSDPVYAETCVTVHGFDIVLDILLVNQTNKTLQNLTVEISTQGDLKLVERPQTYNLPAHDSMRIQANIKVSSTENGIIFGNIVYNANAAGYDPTIIIMNSIYMDVRDYISPAACSNSRFADMQQEFEWENKVPVNTDITDLVEYMNHIAQITNMKCLTPSNTLRGRSEFLAANFYACSIFGEDALLNLSIEFTSSGQIAGYIRIRSKTQGIARSLGDKIQSKQRVLEINNSK